MDYKELWIDGTEWYRWTFELKDSLLKRRFKAVPTYVTLEIASNVVDYVDDAGVRREQKTLWLRHLSLHAEDMTQQEADY
ncbi:hypothetical protein L0O74_12835, partial [Bifidobacterium longum]|nr:hypothetical protein [Bifidobacterium longum]